MSGIGLTVLADDPPASTSSDQDYRHVTLSSFVESVFVVAAITVPVKWSPMTSILSSLVTSVFVSCLYICFEEMAI